MDLTLVIHQEREGFWAEVEELPGCFASAGSLSELAEALGEAVGLYLGDEPVVLEHGALRAGRIAARVAGSAPDGPRIGTS